MTGPLDLDRALTLQQLRTFRAVADHMSFSAAAVDLGISQPSVSYQVKELETVLGLPLLDGLVCGAILGPPVDDAELVAEPFMDDELVMVVPAGHPLGRREGLTLRDFRGEPFLMREAGSGTRLAVEHAAEKAGVALQTAMELGSNGAIKHAVEAGLGVAVPSAHSVEVRRPDGWLVGVEPARIYLL